MNNLQFIIQEPEKNKNTGTSQINEISLSIEIFLNTEL